MLRIGSKGETVVEWQVFLKAHGYFAAGFAPTFGPKTYEGTRRFQGDHDLEVDGIVGPATYAAAERLQANSKTMSNGEIARRAGIPVRVLKAIRHVESRGQADAVRFEPHLFHRKRPDLADGVPYTKSGRGYSLVKAETNSAALEHAMSLDAETAVRSTSFGRYQVLGGYLLEAYGTDAPEAVAAFWANPGEASDLMVAAWFRDNSKARKAANEDPPDFKKLARSYNGPSYHVHKYDERLRAAWERNK